LEDNSLIGLEAETQKKVGDSLSKIGVALSEWDAAKKKPRDLEKQVRHLRRFYGLLSDWEEESLKGSRRRDTVSAAERLRRFVDICREIEAAGIG
jgi:uncharacterized protein (DUF2461 family)